LFVSTQEKRVFSQGAYLGAARSTPVGGGEPCEKPELLSSLVQESFDGSSTKQLHSLDAMLHQQCVVAERKFPRSCG